MAKVELPMWPRRRERDILDVTHVTLLCHVHERDRRDKSHIWLCHVTLVRYICLAVTAAAGGARRWHGNHGAAGLVSQINWTPSTSRVVTSPFACASLRARCKACRRALAFCRSSPSAGYCR